MSQLTTTAKKTYVGLLSGNILIVLAVLLVGQYFYNESIKPIVPPKSLYAMGKMIRMLKEKPESQWPKIITAHRLPWTKLTLSKTPRFEDNALLNFQTVIMLDALKQTKKLQISLFLKEGEWLNISMLPPVPNTLSLSLTVLCLLFILLAALVLLNYWAVKVLNQPVLTLIQSLKYSEEQGSWLPIPLTGNLDQKLIFEKINSLQDKLNQLLENRTRIVTAISHDLRTPLTRLKLRAEYLSENPQFEKIMHDINEMEIMIRETLDYFKEVNNEEQMRRFDLVAMLASLEEDANDLNYKVSFKTDLAKLIYVGNVSLLKRAFSNLINNAVYYGQQAYIELRAGSDSLEIIIEDRGPGLLQEDLEKVFMPFYRAESSRSRETGGTGLGLTITREILQKHRGGITLQNRAEGGLQVRVSLPQV